MRHMAKAQEPLREEHLYLILFDLAYLVGSEAQIFAKDKSMQE